MKWERVVWMIFGAAGAAVGLSIFWLPAPLPADAPPTSFSAARALEHVKAIAKAPHPAGSAEDRRVREYVLKQMNELGLRPREIAARQGELEMVNLYGELAGTSPAPPPLLLVSHYDSTPYGPGAADAASGVATILETIRALKAQGPLPNSLGVLITDAEELGMTGAAALARDHPDLFRDVRLVLNLEARGNHGPVLMFETGPDNARLVQLFGRACPAPVAASFSQDIYRRMPNDTDFTVFERAGKRGFNFAFVGGVAYYHSPRDTPENLSLRTLQHCGTCVLPLVAELGRADRRSLDNLFRPGDATFFPVGRGQLVFYPAWLARVLAFVTAGLFVFAVGKGLCNSGLRIGRTLLSLGVSLLAVVLVTGVGVGSVFGLVRLWKARNYGPFVLGLPFEDGFLLGLLVVAGAITLALRTWLLRRTNYFEALAGAVAIWVAFTVTAAVALPGASYLLLWPALCGTVPLVLPENRPDRPARRLLQRAALTAMPAALLLAPTIVLLHQAITLGVAPVSMALTALAACLMPLRHRAGPSPE